MKFLSIASLLTLSFSGLILAAPATEGSSTLAPRQGSTIINIEVGPDGGLRYDPPFIEGPIGQGQILIWNFHPKNHTITESTEWRPCHKLGTAGTVDSDFNNFRENEQSSPHSLAFTLADASPRFFYCKQANFSPNGHCHKGMVFAVNVSPQRFADFQARANLDGLVQ